MPVNFHSGYSALSRGRYSAAAEEYFLTFNLDRPGTGLSRPPLVRLLIDRINEAESAGIWFVRTGVVMPDHVHLLVRLGDRMALSGAVRRYKGRLAPRLREQGLNWQRSFYDHRMRRGDDVLPVFLYIFLNPFRANLTMNADPWPGYYCAPVDWEWFGPMTNEGVPFPEWLADREGT